MPNWLPDRFELESNIAKLRADNEEKALSFVDKIMNLQPVEQPLPFEPQTPWVESFLPQVRQEPVAQTITPERRVMPLPQLQAPTPVAPTVPVVESEAPKEEVIPFWQRALQIFTAPFNWVDENVIKPGLSLAGTTTGLIPEAERQPGEEFWDWKRRSWEGWQAPGIEIKVPWSKDPKRIDIKGVLEFAPWLLIPGAGQVGGGVRAGVGVAGALAKAGKAGRALGLAVEYSPWGLAEKTAGAAIKGTIKGVFKAGEKVSTGLEKKVFGALPEPKPVSPTVEKLTKFFDEDVIPQRKAFEKELPGLRARQAKDVEAVWKRVRSGEITATEGTALAEKATAGGIKPGFAVKAGQFTSEEVEELLGQVVKAEERGLVTRDANLALKELLLDGTLPEPRHIKEFADVFGEKFAESVRKLRTVNPTTFQKMLDVANAPRAVLASGDVSAIARQGLILGLSHPTQVPKSIWRMNKAFFSEKHATELDDVLRNDPVFPEFVASGGYIAPLQKTAKLAAREESFMSKAAESLPFVRRSERAFITYLNELRLGSYKVARNSWIAQGAGENELKVLAKFINLASGRGELPANLNQYAPLLNAFFFSSRLQMSRLQLPRQLGRMLLSENPYMRKEAAKALVTFLGGGVGLLTLLHNSGLSKVETDPRSGDFGKIKIGETRLDIWTGYVQYARFMAQMLTGERKSAYGNLSKARRDEIVWRFLQSKSSPAFGLFVDLLRGETYMGDEIFKDTKSLIRSAKERLMPLALQDIIDAMEQGGVNNAWTAIPATMGVGTLTYVNDLVKIKEKIARQAGYESWNEIDPKTQREIENASAELQAAYIDFDRQVMGTAWGDWRLAGKAIEDTFKESVELATEQYRQTNDGITFREKVNQAFASRRSAYETRNKMPQFKEITNRMNTKDTAEALVNMGPEQLAIKAYTDALYADDMYDEFGDYRFDEAQIRKEVLRQQLGEELFNYVEEFQGLRYSDLPQEFQELMTAKQVLRPYWEVADEMKAKFGETWAMSSRGQSIINKIKKIKRLRDPQIAYYYSRFYDQSV